MPSLIRRATGILVATVALGGPLAAQGTAAYVPGPVSGQDFQLSLNSMMRGPELVGQPPASVRWTDDSRWIYFRWLPGGAAWNADANLL